jgi:hypothetical protein
MGKYVTGVLRDNRRGATDDSDHVLQVEHASGTTLNVFCPPDLCEDLLPGQTYELIIRGTAFPSFDVVPDDCLRYYSKRPNDDYAGWEGEVVGVNAQFEPGHLTAERLSLYQRGWLLVATQFGQIIMRSRVQRSQGVEVELGGIIRFGGCRLDLYGIV